MRHMLTKLQDTLSGQKQAYEETIKMLKDEMAQDKQMILLLRQPQQRLSSYSAWPGVQLLFDRMRGANLSVLSKTLGKSLNREDLRYLSCKILQNIELEILGLRERAKSDKDPALLLVADMIKLICDDYLNENAAKRPESTHSWFSRFYNAAKIG